MKTDGMNRMDALKLLALDEEDLGVVSAHVQDAVFKVAGTAYDARRRQFTLVVNRFVWEKAEGKRRSFERRRAVLLFKCVSAVRSLGFDRTDMEAVLDLLALRFDVKGRGRTARSSSCSRARHRSRSMWSASRCSLPIPAAPGRRHSSRATPRAPEHSD